MDWSIIFSVIAVNLLLSGDNALAIAMASKGLTPRRQKKVLLIGSTGALLIQILLTYTASIVLDIPYLKIIGGIVLTIVAVKLLVSDEETITRSIADLDLLPTILKIMVANTIMSLDNVLAVAVITNGNPLLLGIGLLVSFPVIIFGSSIIINILGKYPFVMWIGAIFLGWTAGGIIASDAFIVQYLDRYDINPIDISFLFASVVVATGLVLKKLNEANTLDSGDS